MESKRIDLCVPAERNMLLIIRMTTSGVLSRAGLTLDEMDDVKMAVDEACNMLLLQNQTFVTLSISYGYNEEAVHITIGGEGGARCDEKKADANMQEVIRCILEAMVDEVEMTEQEDGTVCSIHLKKNVPDRRRVIA